MKLRVRDTISHQGKDFIIEGVLTYTIDGKSYPLGRATVGGKVHFVEPLMNDLDDRLLLFTEINDLSVGTPPPSSISYQGQSYVPRLTGTATVAVTGEVGDRAAGTCQVWRYRAAGDVFLQIEKWPDKVVTLAGESIHKSMVEHVPGSG